MIDREKVIKGLECIISSGNAGMRDDCANCIYPGGGDCVAPALRDALALLKAQEPRLLRAEDFQAEDADGGAIPCWKEPKSPTRREGWAVIVYGKWYQDGKNGVARYWTTKPSAEQKEATPWL